MQEEAVARGLATSGAAIRFATLVKRRAKEPALMAKMPILLTRLKRKTSSWVDDARATVKHATAMRDFADQVVWSSEPARATTAPYTTATFCE